ncbi:DNA recombination protein RmuC [Nibricoccus aquaticus]|uniref:DNA recombination protein RmuC n=1 Tax=Nibricoccus aquaticus TaxID=2576891 RepID=A0A290QB54_9BACT|nr:DNA recombination protein RmuC [Nibricoccus aquaticus]ATC65899.1 DNA recombination protein RmuC [Nibricoccus aquaticus]
MISALIALAAAALAALLVWLWASARQSTLHERLRARDDESTRLTSDLATTRADLAKLSTLNTRLTSDLSAERAASEEKLKTLVDAHTRLTSEFKALSADALKSNNTAFLELAKTSLAQFQQKAEGDLAARQQAIDLLVKPLKESLEKVDTKIGELEKTRATAYGQLGQQLEALGSAQLRLQSEASKLSTALRSTSYAGSWGELQLRRVVELADMLPYADFAEQETSGALRADLVVRLPGGQRIVIDAKTPVQSYRDALDATDENTRAARLADHAQKIRGHIDALGAKNYWEQFQPAPEFVVLFIPGDHFLTAALQTDSSLLERAIARKVLLATPITLIALLKAASYGWRQEAVSKNADEISRLGRDLYDRASNFADHLEKIGRGLEAAVKGYNSAVGSFETTVLPGARKFAELGAKGTKDLTAPSAVETGLRDLTKRA